MTTKKKGAVPRKRYRALMGLSYPTDPNAIKRIIEARDRGERLPWEERGPIKEVKAGEIVDDIPAVSVPHLLERGRIEEVEPGD